MSVIGPRSRGVPDRRGLERAGVPVRLGGAFKTPRKRIMPTAPGLGGQVGGVGPGKVQRGGDLPGDRDAQAGQLSALVRVVAQQPDAVGAERVQHLGRAGVVALVGPVTEREIRVVRIQTAILQRVGVEFVIQSDAAPFLPQIQHIPAVLGDPLHRFAQLRPAVASLAAEHITGEAFTVQAHQRQPGRGGPAEFEGHVLLRVGQAGEADDRGSG